MQCCNENDMGELILKQYSFAVELDELCKRAINEFGIEVQIAIAIEELGELISELARIRRGTYDLDKIAHELADVDIMVSQLAIMLNNNGIDYEAVIEDRVENLRKIVTK